VIGDIYDTEYKNADVCLLLSDISIYILFV